jgi:hypothetical protein
LKPPVLTFGRLWLLNAPGLNAKPPWRQSVNPRAESKIASITNPGKDSIVERLLINMDALSVN